MASTGLGMGQGFSRVLGALGGRCVLRPPKNNARRSGDQRPRGRRDESAIALVGGVGL